MPPPLRQEPPTSYPAKSSLIPGTFQTLLAFLLAQFSHSLGQPPSNSPWITTHLCLIDTEHASCAQLCPPYKFGLYKLPAILSAAHKMAAPNPPDSETSYIKMTDVDRRIGGDVALVGKHCQMEYCNQLDFLPFFCQSCSKTFCLDHRSESSHKCSNEGAWAERRRQALLAKHSAGEGKQMRDFVSQKPCADPKCKTVIGTSLTTGVHCSTCNRDYCLKHRLREDHNCANLTPIGARPGECRL